MHRKHWMIWGNKKGRNHDESRVVENDVLQVKENPKT